jgi:hypothetical protein
MRAATQRQLQVARKQLTPPPDSSSTAAASGIVPRLLRRAGAAHYLGISEPTLDAYRAQGFIKPVPMPDVRGAGQLLRIPLFDRSDLDAFVDRAKAGGVYDRKKTR